MKLRTGRQKKRLTKKGYIVWLSICQYTGQLIIHGNILRNVQTTKTKSGINRKVE